MWNWGFPCTKICSYWHICSHPTCLTIFDDTHREIQHAATSLCVGHSSRLKGMTVLHPKPLNFPKSASVADTVEACERYNVKLPSLNASLFEKLLSKTMIDKVVQASLVKGWRVGFDLGSAIPAENHFVKETIIGDDQSEALAQALIKERDLGRLHGPIDEPYYDGQWFKNYCWVSPYFVIPKTTPEGMPQKWRVIHHLSYHNSGERRLSFNGHINMDRHPTYFPTYLTGAHLIF